ncbi:hypothetical protein LINPERHAP2_LOCUS33045, partial [Linum perenne]
MEAHNRVVVHRVLKIVVTSARKAGIRFINAASSIMNKILEQSSGHASSSIKNSSLRRGKDSQHKQERNLSPNPGSHQIHASRKANNSRTNGSTIHGYVVPIARRTTPSEFRMTHPEDPPTLGRTAPSTLILRR